MSRIVAQILLAGAFALAACSDSVASRVTANRVIVGDTVIMRAGEPIWGDSVTLVEDLTIGVLEGPEEYLFGQVSELAVDATGGVYVFDAQVPALRYYDVDGQYVRTLGREGEGPGEYYDVALGLEVRPGDGRVVLRDPRNRRLSIYDPDGQVHDSWRIASGLFTANAMTIDTADRVLLKILTGPTTPETPWPIGLMRITPDGEVLDTLLPPPLPGEPTRDAGRFGAEKVWAYSPLGGFVVGLSDQYSFEHRREDGTVLRIERTTRPVRLEPDELREHRAYNDWWRRTRDVETPDVPDVKPAFRAFDIGKEGRIWVRRFAAAVKSEGSEPTSRGGSEPPPPLTWVEPTLYDVFEPSGEFLGTVHVPRGTYLSVLRGDQAWGVKLDSLDVPRVVRFRIRPER